MTRYFLHIHNSHGAAEDDEGLDASSLSEARERAVHGIRSLLASEAANGEMNFLRRIRQASGGEREMGREGRMRELHAKAACAGNFLELSFELARERGHDRGAQAARCRWRRRAPTRAVVGDA